VTVATLSEYLEDSNYSGQVPFGKPEILVLAKQAMWLKHQRLHKYTDLITQYGKSWLKAVQSPELQSLGMVPGAAKKFMTLHIPEFWPETPVVPSSNADTVVKSAV